MTNDEMDTGMARVREAMDDLPQAATVNVDAAWARLRVRMKDAGGQARVRWTPVRVWSLATAGLLAVGAVMVITVAPIRAWAENLLSIFRLEHVAVVDINSVAAGGLIGNDVLNQAIGRIISEEVTVTQPPQKPQRAADVSSAAKLAGFDVHLIAGETPAALWVRSAITAQMKLDRERIQSIVDEAGRTDLHVPSSLDGAVIGMRVPAGILAFYGNCGEHAARYEGTSESGTRVLEPQDATCVILNELPSPTASVPQHLDPAQLAQIALQFAGLSATDAANFTQTVDWTTTFVLPILHGEASYEKVNMNGIEAVLLRPKVRDTSHYVLIWVDNGILYSLMGTGDDTTALNLAEKIE